MINKNAFMISAMKSGSGKTLITLALANLLKKSGKDISIFKTGPDYIDTMYHCEITGNPSTNLDPFFLEPDFKPEILKKVFYENAKGDTLIIEGAMGLFDGIYGEGKRGSACAVSEELDVDVIFVAEMEELSDLKEYLSKYSSRVRGVILNKVPPGININILKEKTEETGLKFIGCLYFNKDFYIKSRHLGLHEPGKDILKTVDGISYELKKNLDLSELSNFQIQIPDSSEHNLSKKTPISKKYRLAYAFDEAFSFTYNENIKVLEEFGFEIIKFSPLRDKELPENIDVIWFPGGYPELFARELSENRDMLNCIYNSKNLPIIAECGGFIYLHETFEDNEKNEYRGAGLIKGRAYKTEKLVRFGYIEVEAASESLLLKKHEKIRSHEFHYFDSTNNGNSSHAVKANKSKEWDCIVGGANIFAGFPHLYLRGYEFMIENLIEFLSNNREKYV